MAIVELLAKHLDKSTEDIRTFLVDAGMKYKIYTIPKRTQGHRVIAQPSRELKCYQRAFLIICPLPAHSCAMAYRKGLSIRENAEAHCRQRYLLKMDLQNFFNSIKPPLFWSLWNSYQAYLPELSSGDKHVLEQMLFWCPSRKPGGKLILSVGAPSSPMISNFCLYNFDNEIATFCVEHGIAYTRYADDMTFSTNTEKALFEIPILIRYILRREFGKNITLNHAKTAFSSKAHNRHVTGVTISNNGTLSLGRLRKRYIKHLTHQFIIGSLTNHDVAHLQGLLSHASHIEPTFLLALKQKYDCDIIGRIREA